VACDGDDPGADLPAVNAEIEAVDDRAVGLGVEAFDGADQIAECTGLAGELTRGEGEVLRFFDGVDAGDDGHGDTAKLAADPDATPDADEAADDFAAGDEAGVADGGLEPLAVQCHCGVADGCDCAPVLYEVGEQPTGGAYLADRVGDSNRLGTADDFADFAVPDGADPGANEMTEFAQLKLLDCSLVFACISATDRIDHAAQEGFIGGEAHGGAGKLFKAGNFCVYPERAANLVTSQDTQLDPQPIADQFAIGKHFEPLQNPTESVGIAGLECCNHGGESTTILGETADRVGLRG